MEDRLPADLDPVDSVHDRSEEEPGQEEDLNNMLDIFKVNIEGGKNIGQTENQHGLDNDYQG